VIDGFLILGTVFVLINEYQKLFRMNEKMDLTLIAGIISTTFFYIK